MVHTQIIVWSNRQSITFLYWCWEFR